MFGRWLLLYLCAAIGPLQALENDVSRAFFYRLGILPDDPHIAPSVKQSLSLGKSEWSLAATYDDLYRFRDPDGRWATLSGFTADLGLVCPWSRKQCVVSLCNRVSGDQYDLNTSNQYIALDPHFLNNTVRGDIYLPYFPFNTGIQLGGTYGVTRSRSSLSIAQFPVIEHQSDLNTYFFDLLEQTFGRTIQYNFDHQVRGGTIKIENGPFFLDGDIRINTGIVAWEYENIESTKLAGTKHTDFNLDASRLNIRAGYTKPWRESYRFTGAVAHWQYRDAMDMLPRNATQRSDGMYLDIRDWGSAQITQIGWGGHTGLDWTVSPAIQLEGAAQLGYSKLDGTGELKTPVLGFVYGLPVGHEFKGDVNGTIFSQYYQGTYHHSFKQRYALAAQAGYLHSLITAHVAGQAGMEFNVATTPVDADYEFTGQVFDAKIDGAARITGHLKIGIAIYQIIPIFKRTQEERHIGPPPAPTAAKGQRVTRGGTEYKLYMAYDN